MTSFKDFILDVNRVRRKFDRIHEAEFKDTEITAAQAIMLGVVHYHPGISATQLSDITGYNKSLITQNVRNLKEHGYIVVTRSDRRTSSIDITESGKQFVAEGQITGEKFIDDVFSTCTPEEREEFIRILHKLNLD